MEINRLDRRKTDVRRVTVVGDGICGGSQYTLGIHRFNLRPFFIEIENRIRSRPQRDNNKVFDEF